MGSQVEIRLRLLERRVEQLAALLLNTTSRELDANWPDYCSQVEAERPDQPVPTIAEMGSPPVLDVG